MLPCTVCCIYVNMYGVLHLLDEKPYLFIIVAHIRGKVFQCYTTEACLKSALSGNVFLIRVSSLGKWLPNILTSFYV